MTVAEELAHSAHHSQSQPRLPVRGLAPEPIELTILLHRYPGTRKNPFELGKRLQVSLRTAWTGAGHFRRCYPFVFFCRRRYPFTGDLRIIYTTMDSSWYCSVCKWYGMVCRSPKSRPPYVLALRCAFCFVPWCCSPIPGTCFFFHRDVFFSIFL